jgi:hypothetical protein
LNILMVLLRSWVQLPPGPSFPVVQIRHYFELVFGKRIDYDYATSGNRKIMVRVTRRMSSISPMNGLICSLASSS